MPTQVHRSLATFFAALVIAAPAAATQSVDLLFVRLNGDPILDSTFLAVQPGDRVGVEMRMTTDAQGVAAYSVSVDFDGAGDGRIALAGFANVVDPLLFAFELTAPDTTLPGLVRHFTAANLAPNPATEDTSFVIGSLDFVVTAAITEGPALIAPGLFSSGVDEILSNDLELIGNHFVFNDVSAEFQFSGATLSAKPVPEPSTAVLCLLGLVGLTLTRRVG